ncbi:MAG: hypothetical protein K8S62_05440 [Candidatus Sabulitectum sp.]|nr:hypothetical protein [Candidatus Sabulitectum sp.]
MDNLKMHSTDITNENIESIAKLFPNCITESENDKGKLKRSIDFDLLRQELSTHVAEAISTDVLMPARCLLSDTLSGRCEPLRVVLRDSGFKDDNAKINVEQISKFMLPYTEENSI